MNLVRINDKQKLINIAIFVFFSIVVFLNIYRYFLEINDGGGLYSTGDWLINYGVGFIRRGAFGQIALFISNLIKVELIWTVAMLQALATLISYYLVLAIYFKTSRSYLEMMILFSPAFLMFPFYEFAGGFRKEVLVFIPFLLYLLFLYDKKLSTCKILLIFSMYVFSILSHELSVFVVPFFIYVTFIFYHMEIISIKSMKFISISFIVVSIAGAFTAIIFSGAGKSEALCDLLMQRGLKPPICSGAIKWLEYNMSDNIRIVINNVLSNDYIFTYFAALFLSLLPFMFLRFLKLPPKNYYIFITLSLVYMLPLFIFAIDWGRWIYIFIFFASNLIFVLIPLGYIKVNVDMPITIIAIYALFWSIPHYGGGGLNTGMGVWFSALLRKLVAIFFIN